MRLSLDASTAIDVLRGTKPAFRSYLDAARLRDDEIWISSIVAHELAIGALASGNPRRHGQELDALLENVPVVDFTVEDAFAAAQVHHELAGIGQKIGALDMLIAGQARTRGWSVVTGNVKHFGWVSGLSIINWDVSQQPLDPEAIAASLRRPPKD